MSLFMTLAIINLNSGKNGKQIWKFKTHSHKSKTHSEKTHSQIETHSKIQNTFDPGFCECVLNSQMCFRLLWMCFEFAKVFSTFANVFWICECVFEFCECVFEFVNVFSSCKCVLVFCLRLTFVGHRTKRLPEQIWTLLGNTMVFYYGYCAISNCCNFTLMLATCYEPNLETLPVTSLRWDLT